MADHRERINELAELMQEFRLSEATWSASGFSATFRKRAQPRPALSEPGSEEHAHEAAHEHAAEHSAPELPKGTPITSPMTGIFYASPNPSAPPFVREGDTVAAGQVIGLIEAMKVFNEIPAPISGTVSKVLAQSGQLVQPGDPLLIVL